MMNDDNYLNNFTTISLVLLLQSTTTIYHIGQCLVQISTNICSRRSTLGTHIIFL